MKAIRPALQNRELLPHQLYQMLVLEIPRGANDHVVGDKETAIVIEQELMLESPYCLFCAKDRLAKRVILPEILGEDLVHEVIGIVLVHLDFFEDDAPFASDFLFVENRVQNDVADDV